MDVQVVKVKRSVKLIKGFMALVVFMQALQVYQTNILDLGAIAGAIGVLLFLRGLLLSPSSLSAPLSSWFKPNVSFSKESLRHFIFALILILVSGL